MADAASVAATLAGVAAQEPVVIVDLAGSEFIDSSGMAALVLAREQARRASGDLLLAAPQDRALRVFAAIRLAEVFCVNASVEKAAASAGRSGPVAVRGWLSMISRPCARPGGQEHEVVGGHRFPRGSPGGKRVMTWRRCGRATSRGMVQAGAACGAAGPDRGAGLRPLAGRMTGSRQGRIWGLVAAQAGRHGGRVSAADVCAAAVAAVGVSGAWLSAAGGADAGSSDAGD